MPTPPRPPDAFHVVLVHGTFARGADWTQPGKSTLCAYLQAAFDADVSFSSPEWTGANTYRARLEGSVGLAAHLQEAPRPVFLVGHSHGGSVIAYALARNPALCADVAGVVFLATPFVHARILPMARHLAKGPALFVAVFLGVAAVVGGAFLVMGLGGTMLAPLREALMLSLPFVGVALAWTVFRLVRGRLTPADDGVHDLVRSLDLGTLAQQGLNHKALVLRSPADEAASGLSGAQLAARIASDLPALLWKAPASIARTFGSRLGFQWRDGGALAWPSWTVWAAGLSMLATTLAMTVVVAAYWVTSSPLLAAADTTLRSWTWWLFEAGFLTLAGGANLLVFGLMVTAPLTVLAVVVKRVSLWGFGLSDWPLLAGSFVELSVEPAPPGEWHVNQLDASRLLPVTAEGTLAHSMSYDDPRAHRLIETLIADRCAELQTSA